MYWMSNLEVERWLVRSCLLGQLSGFESRYFSKINQ